MLAHGAAQAGDGRPACRCVVRCDLADALRSGARAVAAAFELADIRGCAGAEHQRLEQRIRGKAVGAVQARRRHFADGP